MCEVSVWPLYEKNKRKLNFPTSLLNVLINILLVEMNTRFKASKKDLFIYLFIHLTLCIIQEVVSSSS